MSRFFLFNILLFVSISGYSQSDNHQKKDVVLIEVKDLKGFVLFQHSEPKKEGKVKYRNRLKWAKKGRIKLKIKPSENPVPVYTTSFRNLYSGLKKGSAGEANSITFYTEPGKDLKISGHVKDKIIYYKVDSSINNYWYVKHRDMILPYMAESEKSESKDKLPYKNTHAIDSINFAFVREHPNTLASVLIMSSLSFNGEESRFMECYAFCDYDSLKTIPFGDHVNSVYENIEKMDAPSVGKPAPDFTIDHVNDTTKLSKINEYVLLDFWGTWCAPCISEMPELSKFNKLYGDSIKVIGISYNSKKSSWEKLIKKYDLNYEQVFEGEELVKKYGIRAFPSKVLIAPDGTVKMNKSGSISELESDILDLANIEVKNN